jgi:DNA invertase Pin-like site-specific DNA recombinase
MKERQKEGILIAKQNGIYKGRERVKIPENFEVYLEKYKNSTRTYYYGLNDFMKDTGLKKNTILKIVKEFETNSVHPSRYFQSKKRIKNN